MIKVKARLSMVQVMHVFSLFYKNNEKLSKFTNKGQVLHAQRLLACLLACIQMTLPNKGNVWRRRCGFWL